MAEIFYPWGDKPCHQICLYYMIDILPDIKIPMDGKFIGDEHIEGRNFNIEFHWVPLNEVKNIDVYPTNAAELLGKLDAGVQHFIYREE